MKYSIIGNFLLIWNHSINRKYSINQIYSITVINYFGTEISKRLLHRGPDGHWGSRHYTVRLFILCGYIFFRIFHEEKKFYLSAKCNQCDFSFNHARVLSTHIKHYKIPKLPWYHKSGLSWYCQWGHTWGLSWHRSHGM